MNKSNNSAQLDPSLKHLTTDQLLLSTQFKSLLATRRQKREEGEKTVHASSYHGARPLSSKGTRTVGAKPVAGANTAEDVVSLPLPVSVTVEAPLEETGTLISSVIENGAHPNENTSTTPVIRKARSPSPHRSPSPAARARSMVNDVFDDVRADVIVTSMGGKDHRRHSKYVNDIRVRTLTAVPAQEGSDKGTSKSRDPSPHSDYNDLATEMEIWNEENEEVLTAEVDRAQKELAMIRSKREKLLAKAQKEKAAEERRGLVKEKSSITKAANNSKNSTMNLTDSAAAAADAYASKTNSAFLKPLPRRIPEARLQEMSSKGSSHGKGLAASSRDFMAVAESDKGKLARKRQKEQLTAAAEVQALSADLESMNTKNTAPTEALPDTVTYGQVRSAHHAARQLLRNQRPFRFTTEQLGSIIPRDVAPLLIPGETLRVGVKRLIEQIRVSSGLPIRSTTPTSYFGSQKPTEKLSAQGTSARSPKPSMIDTGDPLWQVFPEALSYYHHTSEEDRTTALRLSYLFLEAGLMASTARVASANTERVIRSVRGTLTPTMTAVEEAIIHGVLDPNEVAASNGKPIYTPVSCGIIGPDQGSPCGSVLHYAIVEKSRPTASHIHPEEEKLSPLSTSVFYVSLHWTVPLSIFIDDRGAPQRVDEDTPAHEPSVRTIPTAPLGTTRAVAHATVVEAVTTLLPIVKEALQKAAAATLAEFSVELQSPSTVRGDVHSARTARDAATINNKIRTIVCGHGAAGALAVALSALLAPPPIAKKGLKGSPKGPSPNKVTRDELSSNEGNTAATAVPKLSLPKKVNDVQVQEGTEALSAMIALKTADGSDASSDDDRNTSASASPSEGSPQTVALVPPIDLNVKSRHPLPHESQPASVIEPPAIAICGVVALGSPQIFPSINDKRRALARFGAYSRTQHRNPKANASIFCHFALPTDPIIQQPISYAGGGSGIGMGIIIPGTDFIPFGVQKDLQAPIFDHDYTTSKGLGGLFEPRLLPCHEADVNDAALDEADLMFAESQGNLSSVRSVDSVDDELAMLIRRKKLHDLHLAALQTALAGTDRKSRKPAKKDKTSSAMSQDPNQPKPDDAPRNLEATQSDGKLRERASSVSTTATSSEAQTVLEEAATGAVAADAPDFDATQTLLLPIIHSTEAECFKAATLNAYLVCLLEIAKAAVQWLGQSVLHTALTSRNTSANSAKVRSRVGGVQEGTPFDRFGYFAGTLQQDLLYFPLQAPCEQPTAFTMAPLSDAEWEAMPSPFRQFLGSQFMLPLRHLYSPTLMSMERLSIVFPTTAERVDVTSKGPETAVDFYHATTQAAIEAKRAKRLGVVPTGSPTTQHLAGSSTNTSAMLRGAPTPRTSGLTTNEESDQGHRFSPMLVRCLLSILPPSPELVKALEEELDEAEERRRMQFIAPEVTTKSPGEAKSQKALERCYRSNSSAITLASLLALLKHAVTLNNNAYQPSAAVKGLGGKGLAAPNAAGAANTEGRPASRPGSRQQLSTPGLTAAATATPYGIVEGTAAGTSFLQLPFLSLGDLCARLPPPPTSFSASSGLGPVPDPLHIPFIDSSVLLKWAWEEYCCPQTGPRFVFLLLSLPEIGVTFGPSRPSYTLSPNTDVLDTPGRESHHHEVPKELIAPHSPYHRYHSQHGCGYSNAWVHVGNTKKALGFSPSTSNLSPPRGSVTSKPSTPPPPTTSRPNYLDLFTEDGLEYTFAISTRTKLTPDVRGRVPAAAKAVDGLRTMAERQRQAEEVREGWKEGKRIRYNPSDAAIDKEKRKKSLALHRASSPGMLAMPPLLPTLCPIIASESNHPRARAASSVTAGHGGRNMSVTSLQRSPLKGSATLPSTPSSIPARFTKQAELALRHLFQRHSTYAPVSPLEPREGEEGPDAGRGTTATTSSELPVAAPPILQFECVLALATHTPMAGADLSLPQLDAASGVPMCDIIASALGLMETELVASYNAAKESVNANAHMKSPFKVGVSTSSSLPVRGATKFFTFSGELVEEGFVALFQRVLMLTRHLEFGSKCEGASFPLFRSSPTSPVQRSLTSAIEPTSAHALPTHTSLATSTLRQAFSYHGYGDYTLAFESIPLPPLLMSGALSAEDAASMRKAASTTNSNHSSRAQSPAGGSRIGSGAPNRSNFEMHNSDRVQTPPLPRRRAQTPTRSAEETAAAEAKAYYQANRRLHRHMCLHWAFTACRCQDRATEHKLMCRREQKALRSLMEKLVLMDATEGVGSYASLLNQMVELKEHPPIVQDDHKVDGAEMGEDNGERDLLKASALSSSPRRKGFADEIWSISSHPKVFGSLPHSLLGPPLQRKARKGNVSDKHHVQSNKTSTPANKIFSEDEPPKGPIHTGFVASKRYQSVYGSSVPRLLNDQQRAYLGLPPSVPLALRDLIRRYEEEQQRVAEGGGAHQKDMQLHSNESPHDDSFDDEMI